MLIRARLGAAMLAGAVLVLVVIGPAAARTQAGPRYGGTLVVGIGSDPPTLDPTLSLSGTAAVIYRTTCEQLYTRDAKSEIVPMLAAALPVISKDKRTYTIPVRQGIQFNDGTPFNAQAVVTTLQRQINLPGSTVASDYGPVDSITTTGPYTVVIHLQTPFTPLLAVLAGGIGGPVMSPTQLQKLGTDFGTKPVCVGPFVFDHRLVGDNITVVKSPYYYDQQHVYLDKIVYKVIPDPAAAAAALMAGDIQVLQSVSPTALPSLQQASNLRVIEQGGLGYAGITINIGNRNGVGNLPYAANVGTPLSSSPLLRRAFEEAIDRATFVKVVYDGQAVPGCTPVSPASPMFDPTVRCTPDDPADARKLVARSGFSNPTVHLLAVGADKAAQFIQAAEAAVGINVVIDPVDLATLQARELSGNFETAASGFSGSLNTDGNIFRFVASSGSRNYSGYSNPRLDLILANSRKATSTKALKTLYHAAFQILNDDRPIIYLSHPSAYAGVSTAVAGVQAPVAESIANAWFK
jgi:peptide/nickel transport system substrate-binding protein